MTAQEKRFSKIAIVISVIFAAFLSAATCYSLEIQVKNRCQIDGDTVYFGDIATFNPKNDSRVEKLREIEISASPSPDTFRRIERDLILYRISGHVAGYKDINIKTPEVMIVERLGQTVDEDKIETIYKDFVLDNAPWEEDQIVFENINVPSSLALPIGDLDWEIDIKQSRNYLGNFSIMIDFLVDGKSCKKTLVSGRIAVIIDTVKSTRRIKRGEIISSEDLVMVSEKKTRFKNSLVTDPAEIIGKRATRSIMADYEIQRGMFQVPPAVEKGDRVVIRAESKSILITAAGKALEEGCIGDQIRVMNISSKKEIIATVSKPSTVEVTF